MYIWESGYAIRPLAVDHSGMLLRECATPVSGPTMRSTEREKRDGTRRAALDTLASSTKARSKEEASSSGLMAATMMVNLWMANLKAMGNTTLQMLTSCMRVNSD